MPSFGLLFSAHSCTSAANSALKKSFSKIITFSPTKSDGPQKHPLKIS